MPLYQYECSKCKHSFDKVLSIKEMESTSPACPKCGSKNVKKLMSSGGIKTGLGGYAGKIR